jgi:hypothetical protein
VKSSIRLFRYNSHAVIFVGERSRNRGAAEGALPIIAQAKEPQKHGTWFDSIDRLRIDLAGKYFLDLPRR